MLILIFLIFLIFTTISIKLQGVVENILNDSLPSWRKVNLASGVPSLVRAVTHSNSGIFCSARVVSFYLNI